MNHAFQSFNTEEGPDERLKERAGILARQLEALKDIQNGQSWSTLKELVFDGRVETLENQLRSESLKNEIDLPTLYRTQGRLYEARRTADLYETVLLERKNITKLNPPTAGERA